MSDFQLGALIGFGACAFLAWYCHGLFLAQMLLAGEDGTEINGVRYELCNVGHMQWLRQRAKPAPGVEVWTEADQAAWMALPEEERRRRNHEEAARGVGASDDASSCPQSPLEQKEGPA